MKTVVLDENVPVGLRSLLPDFDVVTVGYLGWSGIRNGALVSKIDGVYDVLVTGDKNLRYQQNLQARRVAIVELPYTRLESLKDRLAEIIDAISASTPGAYIQIQP